MLGQLATIWKYRHFWLSLVMMDLRTRYRRSALGVGWSLMNPLIMSVVFCVVFSAWFHNPDWRVYGPYFLAGLTLFDFVRFSALHGCTTFFRNEAYIRQVPLPLAIYTLRTVLAGAIHFLIALAVVLLAVCILQPQNIIATLQVSWVFVPGVLLLTLFAWSVSTLASFLTVYFQDSVQILEVGFQVLFFLTPIMYPPEIILDRGMGWLLSFNPIYTFFELIRMPIMSGYSPSPWAWMKALIVCSFFGAAALACHAKLEKKLIFRL